MSYEIQFKRSALNDLKKIGKTEAGRILLTITEKLPKNPEQYEMLAGRFKGLRKLRIGDYRVIFAIKGQMVIIAKIGHRKEVYE